MPSTGASTRAGNVGEMEGAGVGGSAETEIKYQRAAGRRTVVRWSARVRFATRFVAAVEASGDAAGSS